MTSAGQAEGAWIFVSHSHKDLEKVRRTRNALEAKGHNPVLFFLKCLDDDSDLDDLIRREIEARTWFILCDSPNAKASRWVQEEVKLVKSLEGKVHKVIDLDEDLDTQIERVTAFSRRAKVFISHVDDDIDIAEALRSALRSQDFAVFAEYWDLALGTPYLKAIASAIDEAGYYLLLLSPDAVRSELRGDRWGLSALDVTWSSSTRSFALTSSTSRPENSGAELPSCLRTS